MPAQFGILLVSFQHLLSFLQCISPDSVVTLTVREKGANEEERDTVPLRFNFPSQLLLLFFYLVLFLFFMILQKEQSPCPLLCKISCTCALCVESSHCKLYMTPDRCYTDTARCACLSQLHKPLAPQQQEAGAAQSSEGWESLWKAQPGSVPAMGKFDQRPRRSPFSPFWGWGMGFDIPWRLLYLERPRALAAGSRWLLCMYRLSSEAEAAMEMSSNGMEKKYLYYFKLPMGLENGGLNQKSKGSAAVFSLKKKNLYYFSLSDESRSY